MTTINTHGMTIKGLRKASGQTENFPGGAYSDLYNEVFFDRSTGKVWTVLRCSLGHNSWTQYDDPSVIRICETSSHMTMQQLADAIHRAVCVCG